MYKTKRLLGQCASGCLKATVLSQKLLLKKEILQLQHQLGAKIHSIILRKLTNVNSSYHFNEYRFFFLFFFSK